MAEENPCTEVAATLEEQEEAWLARWREERGLKDYRTMEPGPERDAHKAETFRLMYTPGVHPANIPEFPAGVKPGLLEYAQLVAERNGDLDHETEEETR